MSVYAQLADILGVADVPDHLDLRRDDVELFGDDLVDLGQ